MKKLLGILTLVISAILPTTAHAETITKAQWAKRVDGICAYYNARFIDAPSTASEAETMAFYAKHGTAVIKLNNKFTRQVAAVPLPTNGRTLAQTWLRLNAQQTVWNKRFIAAAWRHDLPAMRTAVERETERYDARKPVARALGLKVCTVA